MSVLCRRGPNIPPPLLTLLYKSWLYRDLSPFGKVGFIPQPQKLKSQMCKVQSTLCTLTVPATRQIFDIVVHLKGNKNTNPNLFQIFKKIPP